MIESDGEVVMKSFSIFQLLLVS